MRSRCPLCGNTVHGEAHGTGEIVVHAYDCANCGRFTVLDEVQQRLVTLTDAERAQLTALLLARGSQDARGAALESSDIRDTTTKGFGAH